VVGASITTATASAALAALVLYGLGVGSVIVTLTIAAGLIKAALAVRMRRIVRSVDAIGTIALFAAGAYVVYYWLTIGGPPQRSGLIRRAHLMVVTGRRPAGCRRRRPPLSAR
jgi:hypothetical protein